ncbi:MAG: hypothetical protein ACO3N7_04460 [Kiritimatiellia bacterium]
MKTTRKSGDNPRPGLLIFGGFVILRKLQPEEVTFVEPPTIVRVEPQKRQYKLRAQQQQQRSGRPQLQSRLQSTQVSSFSLPPIKTQIAPVKQKMVTIPGFSEGLGGGLGFGTGMGVGKGASIFGVTIEAENLGVILDVSYSTHRVIDAAIVEIQKAFPDAIIVLGPGCGMKNGREEAEVLSASKFEREKEALASPSFDFEITDYLSTEPRGRGLPVTNRRFAELFETGKQKNQMYVLTWNNRTHTAFEWLMKERVDAIYWFADFQDFQDPEIIDSLIKQLNRRKMKVYQQHLDSGGNPGPEKFMLSEQTGGKVIRTNR